MSCHVSSALIPNLGLIYATLYSFPYSYYNSFASIYYLNHYSNPQCLHWRIRSRYNWSSAVDSVPFQFPSFHEGMDVWNSRNVSPL